jgi:twitching motility protein PilI
MMIIDCFLVVLNSNFNLAIPLARTAEVLAFPQSELCPLPGVCPELLGVNNQRGVLLWVIDLATLLGQAKTALSRPNPAETTKAIVLTQEEWRAAAVVSGLKGLVSVDLDALAPLPQKGLLGWLELDEQPVAILDVDAVFEHLQDSSLPQAVPTLSA